MVDLKVWITRPDSHEVLMGGLRSVQLWVAEPMYCHLPEAQQMGGAGEAPRYTDHGWLDRNTGSICAKALLKQDPELLSRVWDKIVWSCAPRGMGLQEAQHWGVSPTEGDEDPPAKSAGRVGWHRLTDDLRWEARCNRSHKRLLIQVGLRSGLVECIVPRVQLRDDWTGGEKSSAPAMSRSLDISDDLAVEYWHAPNQHTDLPF